MDNGLNIKISDIVFQVFCNEAGSRRLLKKFFTAFLSDREWPPDMRIFVTIDKGWQARPEGMSRTQWGSDSLFLKTQSFDAQIDFFKNKADVVNDPEWGIAWPIRVLISWVLMRKGGVFLHASSILDEERRISYVFSGPSGSGKTTIARLSQEKDTVLTDETTAVARCGDSYNAYATPFAGEYGPVKKNTGGTIKALFFIRQDTRFAHRWLSGREAVQQLFLNSRVHTTGPLITDILFTTFEHFVKTIPCYELSVRPEPGLWRYIDDNIG
jgi:hypothetical protein